MIKVRKFKTCYVQVFNPDGSLLCLADEYTFMDIRCQIAEQKLEGYTYVFNNKSGIISPNGECYDLYNDMFPLNFLFSIKFFKNNWEKDLNEVGKLIDEMVDNSKMSNIILQKDNEVHVHTLNVLNNE